jgi:predicted transcriptional regulator
MRIHEAISKALKQHGISLRSIAAMTGLADSQVSYFLSGQRGMDYKNLSLLIDALPDSVYQEFCRLMTGEPQAAEVEQAIAILASAPLTDEQIALLLSIASQCLRQAPAHNRERLPVVA